MSATVRMYPALFAVLPLVNMAAENPGRFTPADVGGLCLFAAALVIVVNASIQAVLARVMRGVPATDTAAAVTLVLVVSAYLGPVATGRFAAILGMLPSRPWQYGVAAAATLLGFSAVLAAWAWMRRSGFLSHGGPGKLGRVLTWAGVGLVGVAVARIGLAMITGAQVVAKSELVAELSLPVPLEDSALERMESQVPGQRMKRDLYVIILDEYAGTQVLRERYGIDNRRFEDSLRALGFLVPMEVRSNYAVTLLSVASFLNFAHVYPLADDVGAASADYASGAHLIRSNRAARFLKSQGYRFVYFPAIGYTPTAESELADETFDTHPEMDVGRILYGTELGQEVMSLPTLMPLRRLAEPMTHVLFEHAVATLDGVTHLAERDEPIFAVAHVMMPHPPYTVDSLCRPLKSATREKWALPGQVECVNRMTLRTVGELIAKSHTPPLIVVQGDHGTQPNRLGAGTPTPALARERFSTFGAYYLPDGGSAAIPDSVSLVNVLRLILGYYFEADLPPVPDTMYYSQWHLPYALVPLDDGYRAVGAIEAR